MRFYITYILAFLLLFLASVCVAQTAEVITEKNTEKLIVKEVRKLKSYWIS